MAGDSACSTPFQTLVIVDLETTGLLIDQPKITELALIAVNVATLRQVGSAEKLPRVLNKFTKVFNPSKLVCSEVCQISGLNDEMLKLCAPFTRATVRAIELFLEDFQKPICFVAHNGNQFDFPILWMEIQSALSEPSSEETKDPSTWLGSIACTDSIVFFRQMYQLSQEKRTSPESTTNPRPLSSSLDEETAMTNPSNSSSARSVDTPVKYIPSVDSARPAPSMRLGKIYEREFPYGRTQLIAHRAEDDCLMLLAILKRYVNDWLPWIEENHQCLAQFSSPV